MRTSFLNIWSDVEYVYRCLADTERTRAFRAAIREVVKPEHIVLDVGTGSGIMALFAAESGARRVYSVEIGDYLFRASRQIFDESNFRETIVSLHMDARDVTLSHIEKPDVVICENITTGLIGEPQGPVLNSLRRSGVLDDQTILIPSRFSTSIALANVDWTLFDLNLRFPIFVDYFTKGFERRYELLSAEVISQRLNLSSHLDENVCIRLSLVASKRGLINGLLLSSTTAFLGGGRLGNCVSYCQPVLLPTEEIEASKGTKVSVTVNYKMGGGFDTLEYEAKLTTGTDLISAQEG